MCFERGDWKLYSRAELEGRERSDQCSIPNSHRLHPIGETSLIINGPRLRWLVAVPVVTVKPQASSPLWKSCFLGFPQRRQFPQASPIPSLSFLRYFFLSLWCANFPRTCSSDFIGASSRLGGRWGRHRRGNDLRIRSCTGDDLSFKFHR